MGILEDILARLERIETSISSLGLHANTVAPPAPAPQPAQTPAPAPAPAPGPAPGPALASQPAYGPAAPGPQSVPTIEELNALLLDLQQQKGTDLCVTLMRQHQGESPEGNVSLSNIPAEKYVALQQAIRQQLGVH